MMASNGMLSLLDGDAGRDTLRFRVLFAARLITTTADFPVTVRDISTTGAGIEGGRMPVAGTDVLLRRRGRDFFARVMWVDSGRAGLEFDEPISAAELVAQLNAGAGIGAASAATGLSHEQLAMARGRTQTDREANPAPRL